jgi:selenocysteine-specific elongation factor
VGPGSRVAVNLAGASVDDVRRGDVLAPPGALTPSLRFDTQVRIRPDIDWQLAQNTEVDFFTGATVAAARLSLLDHKTLGPGDDGWVQLRFQTPVTALAGDRFVLRRPSPSETLGGGVIIDPTPPRHKRFQPEMVRQLRALASGSPADALLAAVKSKPLPLPLQPTGAIGGLTADQLDAALNTLLAAGSVANFRMVSQGSRHTGYIVAAEQRQSMLESLTTAIAQYHKRYPLRRGKPIKELRGTGADPELMDAAIVDFVRAGLLVREQATVRLPGFEVRFTPVQQAAIDSFLDAVQKQPFGPPEPSSYGLTDELVIALEQLGQVVRLSPEIVLSPAALAELVEGTLATIDRVGSISLAKFRDQFQTSRKYAQAILEYLDRGRITRRRGDERVRFLAPSSPVPSGEEATPGET